MCKRQVIIVRCSPSYSFNFDYPMPSEKKLATTINEEEFLRWESILKEYVRLQKHLEKLWRENRSKR